MDKWVTPNGVTHLIMLLIDIKILQNHAEKFMNFEHPTCIDTNYKITLNTNLLLLNSHSAL